MTSYKCQFSEESIEISWCDRKGGITSKQASINKEALKKILKDHPDQAKLKKENFKLWQTLNILCRSQTFINTYLQHTNLTKMMKCVVIIKSILDWNKNTFSWFNRYWYSQIASVVCCHYNTVKMAMKLVLKLWTTNEKKLSCYHWMDFINYLFSKRKEIKSKDKTIFWLYKANAAEGLLSKRFDNKTTKAFSKPPEKNEYFTKGF